MARRGRYRTRNIVPGHWRGTKNNKMVYNPGIDELQGETFYGERKSYRRLWFKPFKSKPFKRRDKRRQSKPGQRH